MTARRHGPQHPDYQDELRAAKNSLQEAIGPAASEEETSVIRYHLGLVEHIVSHLVEMPKRKGRKPAKWVD